MDEEKKNESGGFWGSTLSKLKSALTRTRQEVVDDVLERQSEDVSAEEAASVDAPQSSNTQVETAQQDPHLQASALIDQGQERVLTNVNAEPVATHASTIAATTATTKDSSSVVTAQPLFKSSAQKSKAPSRPIDDDYLEELEEKLIKADLGVQTAETMVEHLRKEARKKNWRSEDVEQFLKEEFSTILRSSKNSKLQYQPNKLNLYLVVGVNGTGKTTSIGKLCHRFKSEGKKVLVAAADTFRAAAETQLEIWAGRTGVDICRLPDGADPGAVVFEALNKAKVENYDVVVIDTAGRLHNKTNLMLELKKIRGVIEKHGIGLPLESLLVLDASTGQNGMKQAQVFTEVCPLTGVILTKLDGTAKGGIVFAIASELKIPVKLIGLGEKMDDLRDFEPELFVEALFG